MDDLESLFSKCPFPWSTEEYKKGDGWAINDANGVQVVFCASFSGDGALIYLDYEQAVAIVEILNKSMANANTAQTM